MFWGCWSELYEEGVGWCYRVEVLHTSCIGDKTVERRESCSKTEGDCAVPQFHHAHRSRCNRDSPTLVNRDDGAEENIR